MQRFSSLAIVLALLSTAPFQPAWECYGDCTECSEIGNVCGASCQCHCCTAKIEPTPVKKTVYSVKCVPVCEHRPSGCLQCDRCPVCKLYYKRVVIKREIVVGYTCTTSCEPVPVDIGCCDAEACTDEDNAAAIQTSPPVVAASPFVEFGQRQPRNPFVEAGPKLRRAMAKHNERTLE